MAGNSKNKEILVVDGYNIINSWDRLKEVAVVDFEQARLELLEILSEYHHYSGIKTIVVFDAHLVKGSIRKEEEYKGITVVYTKENELADHYIEKMLDELGRIKRIRVATSDRTEQEIILSRGGTRLSARELEAEIDDEMSLAARKRKRINMKNDIQLGRLADRVYHKLKDWDK
ncbi:NYN domain-containing protein [Gudongella oleilytica]|jgi:predicted RNA-binding protein with PIN domain|uniref:NYN domain-containing protein n=1 Tax=Gudongella oleilytica TaxID=1582259 RepID=UPI002A36A29D|nr:NYN domain-containing protein [Gudongella oleilytica]MDY0256647.1 NYN domain-containing protein [Gudongella oleilytica]